MVTIRRSRNITKIVAIASMGSGLEMYDFVIYIFFASTLAKQFFPTQSYFASLLSVFGIFAVGYLCRTIGAFIFGYIGDTKGRKDSLLYTIMLMAFPMLVLTFLPTYDQIGIAAPIFLTIIRCLQGLAVGGEFSGCITLVSEYADPRHRGYLCSWVILSLNLGILLASLISIGVTKFFIEPYHLDWGWRIAFFIGCLLAFVIAYIRKHFAETPIFAVLKAENNAESSPILSLFKLEGRKLAHLIIAMVGPALAVGMIIFLPTYLQNFSVMNSPMAVLAYNSFFLLLLCIFIPIFGRLSDQVGRKPLLIGGLICIAVFVYPIGRALAMATTPGTMLLATSALGIILSTILSTFGSFLAENFPTRYRSSGIGIAYNIPFTLITGTFPLISLLIVQKTHSIDYQYGYIILLAIIALIATATCRETVGKILDR